MSDISIWDVCDDLQWSPHAAQELVLSSDARFRVVAGGRRSGKSEIGGRELVPECLYTRAVKNDLIEKNKRREFWLIGPEFSDSEKEFRVVWNSLKKLGVPFDRPGSYNDPIGMSMHLSCWDGRFQVHAKSAKHPETLVGEGLNGAVLCEAAKLKEKVWTKFVRPMLADHGGWALFSSTPEGRNWFHSVWQSGQDPLKHEWESWRFPSWVNPHVYRKPTNSAHVRMLQEFMDEPSNVISAHEAVRAMDLDIDSEIASLVSDLSTEAFNQEIGADFSEFVGRVFKTFDEEVHVFDLQYNPQWPSYGAVDIGFTNPNVWLLIQVSPWGQVNVLDEVYRAGLTTPEFVEEILARGLGGVKGFYSDPAAPGDNRQLQDLLKVPSLGGTGGEVKDRIRLIREALKPTPQRAQAGGEFPFLRIDRRCRETIREMLAYRYADERGSISSSESPLKRDDHCPEALGRFYRGHFGPGADSVRIHRRANLRR